MNDSGNKTDIDTLLSAYVDGELDFADRRRVEDLIRSDPARAQDVEELRLLKHWLQDLPDPAPRRSFTLDPATAPRPRRLVFPTLRWATAIAAVLLMLTVSVDLFGSGMGGAAGGGATSVVAPAASGSDAAGTTGAQEEARSMASASAAASPAASAAAASPAAAASALESGAASGAASASGSPAAGGLPDADVGVYPPPSESLSTMMASPSTATDNAANNGTGASTVAAPSLAPSELTGPETVTTMAQPAQQGAPVDTLRIAQIVLLIATVALGTGAWVARRRNI